MESRDFLYTEGTSLKDRMKIWDDAVLAIERNIKMANALQKRGIDILKKIQDGIGEENFEKRLDLDKAAKLMKEASALIVSGTNLDTKERERLLALQFRHPKVSDV